MNDKMKYALIVLGIFAVYAFIVYFIRRSMGISSTIEDLSTQKVAGNIMNEMIKEKQVSSDSPADTIEIDGQDIRNIFGV